VCGIAGIVQSEESSESLASVVDEFSKRLRHRGPDDEGIFASSQLSTLNSQSVCSLVHTRLSILDLSDAGHQPMSSPDRRFTITFNGEIYNFRELRKDLEKEGEVFHTRTDTEVILRMFARYGPKMVHELQGMFAFAIWDSKEHRLFLARDPLGVKPLYFTASDGRLAFASELRALVGGAALPARLSPAALYGYFMFGSVPEPYTLIAGVECLPAGHWLEWENGETRTRKYWDIEFGRGADEPSDSNAHVRGALVESLKRHFISDVPVGVFLSGGIDSTVLVALSRSELSKTVETFCISFNDAALNEGEDAQRTAQHFGTRHHDWRMDGTTGRGLLREFLAASDQPSIDGFNTFCVSRHAKSHGLKVVLSGLGGDELFGGYPSFQSIPRLLKFGHRASLAGPPSRWMGSMLAAHGTQPRWRRLGSLLAGAPSTGAAYWSVRGVFTPDEAESLCRMYAGSDCDALPQPTEFFGVNPQPTSADEVSVLELTRYMRNQLLRDSDVMSMASSLELRVPFVDQKFVDEIARVPASLRLRKGKRMLLNAIPEIPSWVAERPKQGFVFPFKEWLQDEWSEFFTEIDSRTPVPLISWYRRWCLLALENFMKTHKIPIPVPH
jgi:asparagine synthase (glutamine-hydrolysing)